MKYFKSSLLSLTFICLLLSTPNIFGFCFKQTISKTSHYFGIGYLKITDTNSCCGESVKCTLYYRAPIKCSGIQCWKINLPPKE